MLALQLLLAQGALAMPRRRVGKTPPQASPRKILLAIRKELNAAQACRRTANFGKRLQKAQREQRYRQTSKERRLWPSRAPHEPPKPPKILKLAPAQKAMQNAFERMPA